MLTFMPQKLITLLTVAMSTVRMDTVWSSGKHVIQSILLTWKYLANIFRGRIEYELIYSLRCEAPSRLFSSYSMRPKNDKRNQWSMTLLNKVTTNTIHFSVNVHPQSRRKWYRNVNFIIVL